MEIAVSPSKMSIPLTDQYPVGPRNEQIRDVYHGVPIVDPYRVLEDPENPLTKKFVSEVNEFATPYFDSWPSADRMRNTLNESLNRRRFCCGTRQNGHTYIFTNSGRDNQNIYTKDSAPFIDVNQEDPSGSTEIRQCQWTHLGKKILAYAVSVKGSDGWTIRFKHESGEDYEDQVHNAKHTNISWYRDYGVFYSKYQSERTFPSPPGGISTVALTRHALYYHQLGTTEDMDLMVFDQPEDPRRLINGHVSPCGCYLYIVTRRGSDPSNQLFIYTLSRGISANIQPFVVDDSFQCRITVVGNVGNRTYVLTNRDAPRFRVMYFEMRNGLVVTALEEFVPEHEKYKLDWAHHTSAGILCCYISSALESIVVIVNMRTELPTVLFRGCETMTLICGWPQDEMLTIDRESFLKPVSSWELHVPRVDPENYIWKCIKWSQNIEVENIEVTDHYARSVDGEKVHYFVMSKKLRDNDGTCPVLVHAYGGFGVPMLPSYSVPRIIMCSKLNAIYVIVNARGGGEYGEKWHQAGMLHKKHNTFNDVMCVVERLVERKMTTYDRVALHGDSNGGLVMMATAQKHPTSIGAVISNVAVLDMIRFPKFTIGAAWKTEFGNPDNVNDFRYLMSYSPLHNIHRSNLVLYPAVLVMAADHDERVIPGHSLKFLAELFHQARMSGVKRKFFGRIEENSGHGLGKSTRKRVGEIIDMFAFLHLSIGLDFAPDFPY